MSQSSSPSASVAAAAAPIDPAVVAKVRAAAEAGDARAAYELGMAYANGEGVQLDYVEASRWIRQAAEAGLALAQRTLAWLYSNGLGVEADDGKAVHWYLAAAEQGDPRDQHFAATIYRYGRYDVAKDPERMLHWYSLSANQGFAPAQCELGQLLLKGKYVARDDQLAFQWLSLAVVNGSRTAPKWLRELSERMDPDLLHQAKKAMLTQAAEQDS
ncbi:MAG: sel1 repeat family protein [Gammaproteobacteria bacterium]|nr:sel1 repeat family protein [Gammaproteobacteria bacterium]MCP5135669.1 sel1 repeat family protein [Gammaproteobacteria bacterium]